MNKHLANAIRRRMSAGGRQGSLDATMAAAQGMRAVVQVWNDWQASGKPAKQPSPSPGNESQSKQGGRDNPASEQGAPGESGPLSGYSESEREAIIAKASEEMGVSPARVQELFGSGRLAAKAPSGPSVTAKWKAAKGSANGFSDDELERIAGEMGVSVARVKELFAEGRLHRPGEQSGKPAPRRTEKEEIAGALQAQGNPSKVSEAADAAQLGLDAAGVADPTPIADGANAAISVGRMFTDPKRWKQHAGNAAISAVSTVPYIGDFAKLAKAKQAAKVAGRATSMGTAAKGAKAVEPPPIIPGAGNSPAAVRIRKENAAREAAVPGAQPTASKEQMSVVERVRESMRSNREQRGEQREKARSWMERGWRAVFGSEEQGRPAAAGGSPPGGTPPPGQAAPGAQSPGGDDEEKGVRAYRKFTEKLREGGKAVAGYTGKIGKFAMGLGAAVKGLSLFNTGVLALNRDLERYNGRVASAYAKYDSDAIQRDIRKGESLDEPLSKLLEEQSELKDSFDEYSVPIQQIGLSALAHLTEGVNYLMRLGGSVMPIADLLRYIVDWLPGNQGLQNDPALTRFFEEVANGAFDGKRPKFPPKNQGKP